ncbi:hypothetical protein [Paraburkholderia xenovorans]|uniref:hypothetical protein n=1 Tax=Paraburkholderia xenovorans TaxID=36873 RepID=UPI0038BB353A
MVSLFGKLLPQADPPPANARAHARRRNFAGDLVPASAADDPMFERVDGSRFVAERSYFSIRIVEMRLADARNYIATFLPMCSCFIRYPYGSGKREIPFVVGYDMIRQALGKDAAEKGGQRVEFKNIYIVENAPVKAGTVEMYAALCRVADSTFARGMLDLLADTVSLVGGPAAGLVARSGIALTERLAALLGADGVDTRFGMLNGAALDKSGYRVFAGADSERLAIDELQMKQGQLYHQPPGAAQPATIDDIDYLVIAIEYQKSLVSDEATATANPAFQPVWEALLQKLRDRDEVGAENARNQLMLQIAVSPDLVAADRLALSLAYSALIGQWKSVMMPAAAQAVRGAGGTNLSTRLENAANSEGAQSPAVKDLLRLAGGWISAGVATNGAHASTDFAAQRLAKAAGAFRKKLDAAVAKPKRGDTSTDVLDEANAKFVAAALSGRI